MWFLTVVCKNVLHRKIRSILTCVSMGVAMCGLVTMVGISAGFERAITSMFETRGVDVIVSRARSPQRLAATLDESLAERFRQVPGVERVDPMLVDVVSFEQGNLIAVYVFGWPPEGAMFGELRMVEGRALQADDHRATLLAKLLADSLGKRVGDRVEIEGDQFTVVGVFEASNMLENGTAIVNVRELQELTDRQGRVNAFLLRVASSHKNKEAIDTLCRHLQEMCDEQGKPLGIVAMTTQDHVKSNLELRVMRAMAWATAAIALLIGVIGMVNTMMISVFERTREIGALRAVGWGKGRVAGMILMESLLLSCAGALLGLLLSGALTSALSRFEITSTFVPKRVDMEIMLEGCTLAILAGLIGCLFPALRASRLLPTEALRHE